MSLSEIQNKGIKRVRPSSHARDCDFRHQNNTKQDSHNFKSRIEFYQKMDYWHLPTTIKIFYIHPFYSAIFKGISENYSNITIVVDNCQFDVKKELIISRK